MQIWELYLLFLSLFCHEVTIKYRNSKEVGGGMRSVDDPENLEHPIDHFRSVVFFDKVAFEEINLNLIFCFA